MRRLVVFDHISLDGCFANSNTDTSWAIDDVGFVPVVVSIEKKTETALKEWQAAVQRSSEHDLDI